MRSHHSRIDSLFIIWFPQYAGACAAAQTAIHSLQGDGYHTEWVTSPVTKTPAFRTLVKAKPTDRIAALIRVDDRPRNEQSFSGRQR